MSATNRGAVRVESDFYATPKAAFDPLLPYLPMDRAYWEPCCGDGRLIRWLNESGRTAAGSDLFPQTPDTPAVDFLKDETPREFTVTNPPFGIAQAIADHALAVSHEVMLLLRLNFLSSKGRRPWWRAHPPSTLFVLGDRPSFAIFCQCKSSVEVPYELPLPPETPVPAPKTRTCGHKWSVMTEKGKPKVCPKCTGTKIQYTTSDATDYCWVHWQRPGTPRRYPEPIYFL